MRFFILFVFLSIILLSCGNDAVPNGRHSSGSNRIVPAVPKDFAGNEAHSTDPEKMKKMQMLQPQFRLMN